MDRLGAMFQRTDKNMSYRSPYAPKYTIAPNIRGLTYNKTIGAYGLSAALFGGVAGVAVMFFASDIPRVRHDIMQKIPIIGPYFIREVPPEDNPF